MRNYFFLMISVLIFSSCLKDDETCLTSEDCDAGMKCEDGVCVDDMSDTGKTGDTGDSGNTGNTGDSGDSGDSGESGSSGSTGETGNSGSSGSTGETGDTGNVGPSCGDGEVEGDEICDGNGVVCSDVAEKNYNNDATAPCKNTCDGWDFSVCTCPDGFEKNYNETCVDIDECSEGTHNCDENAECKNTEGSFTCECKDYFSGDGETCEFCEIEEKCGENCEPCGAELPYCKNNGDGTTKCVECLEDDHCNTEDGEMCNARNKCSQCPLPRIIGTWDDGNDGWTSSHCAWKRDADNKFMKYWAGLGTSCVASSYNHFVTKEETINLSKCDEGKVKYSVTLVDSDNSENDTDKSERLIMQCYNGSSWQDIKPSSTSPWPSNQSACKDYYCDGGNWPNHRGFDWTEQSINIPAACLIEGAQFRFRAWGTHNWRINYWGINNVILDDI